MAGHLQKILYTAEAVAECGREGRARSLNRRLVVDLSIPEAMGGSEALSTGPEQLFAVGYAAGFQAALFSVANGQRLDASESQIICRVGFGAFRAVGAQVCVTSGIRGRVFPLRDELN